MIAKVDEVSQKGFSPVLVISPPLRSAMRRFAEKFIKNINVISHNEISENVRIESLGMLEIKI
jgi:flagellar biosynthesis protein FlhA